MRLSLPPPPETSPPAPFPVLGVVAPLIAAAVLFAVTRSPYALIFAALSPVILVAGILDARVSARRRRRRARRIEKDAVARLRDEVAAVHAVDRASRLTATPSTRAIVSGAAPDSLLWRGFGTRERPFVLGLAPVPSGVSIDGIPGSADARALVDEAAVLRHAPATVGRIPDVGLCGPPVLTSSVARGLVLQIAFLVHPAEANFWQRPSGEDWRWVERLPHWGGRVRSLATDSATGSDPPTGTDSPTEFDPLTGTEPPTGSDSPTGTPTAQVRIRVGGEDIVIAMAESASALPRVCDTVLLLVGATEARLLSGSCTAIAGSVIRPDLVSRATAEAVARRLADRATRIATRNAELPDRVELQELVSLDALPPGAAASGSLASGSLASGAARRRTAHGLLRAVLGRTSSGVFTIDLARDGPHAVIGGTTGSGKSELLITWVVSSARTTTPAFLTFLLVDFKGGASFDALARLPHCVGFLTDLDSGAVRRAIESLRAELRHRERWLRERGIRSLSDADEEGIGEPRVSILARLVIVVDEFAAMLAEFPELHDVFADIASRGRSLGIHLILCTQRPVGVVRDAVLANCGLRLSLRVTSRADSMAVIGSDAAASLPQSARGRCLVSISGAAVVPVQIATVDAERLARFVDSVRKNATGEPPRRPWLDPLPAVLALSDLEDPTVHRGDLTGAMVFGLTDEPAEQRRSYAAWHPERDGSLLVLGTHRSGKTCVLATLAAVGTGPSPSAPRFVRVPSDPVDTWDAVSAAFEDLRAGVRRARILALDDVDALLARYDPDYAQVFLDMLSALAREGPGAGIRLVLTAQRLSAGLSGLAPLLGRTLLLRMPNRQEHALAGGDVSTFDSDLVPGGGWWRGFRVQVALCGAARATPATSGRHAATSAPVVAGDRAVLRSRAATVRADEAGRLTADDRATSTDRRPDDASEPSTDPVMVFRAGDSYAIVSTRPAAVVPLLRVAAASATSSGIRLDIAYLSVIPPTGVLARAASPTGGGIIDVILGDPDEWQAAWGALAAASRARHVVFDACSARDYRTLTRSPTLPPPLRSHGRSVWYLPPTDRPARPERRQWPP
ncbi:FtsK/SpoIIIE domain-containing protein [Planctomonas psychrotolerans]|uniref:FtsK/SpoIIIE domain-containing protein n=1 Tax=Planctomonas psychrotolerans TaxID=2528712 RepID=UPI00123B18FF|nr:FtsK/SpoIIIE domain-containing protein [Planctomonas psychrotolerans]